eukprot:578717-Amphidinium_carterae.1
MSNSVIFWVISVAVRYSFHKVGKSGTPDFQCKRRLAVCPKPDTSGAIAAQTLQQWRNNVHGSKHPSSEQLLPNASQ